MSDYWTAALPQITATYRAARTIMEADHTPENFQRFRRLERLRAYAIGRSERTWQEIHKVGAPRF